MNGTKGPKWAVYSPELFWMTDTCAGGSWSPTVEEAEWFDSPGEASEAFAATEATVQTYVVRVR